MPLTASKSPNDLRSPRAEIIGSVTAWRPYKCSPTALTGFVSPVRGPAAADLRPRVDAQPAVRMVSWSMATLTPVDVGTSARPVLPDADYADAFRAASPRFFSAEAWARAAFEPVPGGRCLPNRPPGGGCSSSGWDRWTRATGSPGGRCWTGRPHGWSSARRRSTSRPGWSRGLARVGAGHDAGALPEPGRPRRVVSRGARPPARRAPHPRRRPAPPDLSSGRDGAAWLHDDSMGSQRASATAKRHAPCGRAASTDASVT